MSERLVEATIGPDKIYSSEQLRSAAQILHAKHAISIYVHQENLKRDLKKRETSISIKALNQSTLLSSFYEELCANPSMSMEEIRHSIESIGAKMTIIGDPLERDVAIVRCFNEIEKEWTAKNVRFYLENMYYFSNMMRTRAARYQISTLIPPGEDELD